MLELNTKGALHLLGEEQLDGLNDAAAQRGHGGRDVLGRAAGGKAFAGTADQVFDKLVGGAMLLFA